MLHDATASVKAKKEKMALVRNRAYSIFEQLRLYSFY